MVVFFVSVVLVFRFGFHYLMTGRGALFFSIASTWFFAVALVSIVSLVSVYYYELPTHHCPFDILQKEYHYIGYPLYASLFCAGSLGMGMGIVERYKMESSIASIAGPLQKRICVAAMISCGIFVFISAFPILFSEFKLLGY
jgi:hypothetical protein